MQTCRVARLRVHRDHRPLAAFGRIAKSLGRDDRATGRRDCPAAREIPGHRDPARLRGRHPAGRPPRLPGSRFSNASTSSSPRCTSAPATRPTSLLRRYEIGDEASARDADHASDQSPRAAQARLRPRLRRAVRDGGRDRHDRRDRRLAGPSRPRWPAGPPGDRRRRDDRGRQRLPPRRTARHSDGARRHDRAAAAGSNAGTS